MSKVTPTYTKLVELLVKYEKTNIDIYSEMEDIELEHAIGYAMEELCDGSETKTDTWMLGIIGRELKRYNVLWFCSDRTRRNGSRWKAIRKLQEKGVLIRTETTGIYIVDPRYIRRSSINAALVTTANMLAHVPKVLEEHIVENIPNMKLVPRNSMKVGKEYDEQSIVVY